MTYESKENQVTEGSDSSSSTSSTITTSSHPSALSLQALGDESPREATKQSEFIPLQQSINLDDLKRTSNPRHVSFDSVHVHEHAVILGCNPGLRALPTGPGPALTLAWESLRSNDYDMDDFEAQRQLTRRPRESLRTTKSERVQFLKDEGFTSEELKMAEDAIRHIQQSREASAQEKSDLSAMLRESKERQQEKRKKKRGNFVRKMFRVLSAKT